MLTDKIMQLVSSRTFTIFAALLLSIVCVNWAVPTNYEADTILQSLMSTHKVTLFYWGQDRYLNFLPFLYSWIQSPTANLLLIILTSGASYFLLLELLSDTFAKLDGKNIGIYRLIFFITLVLVSVLVLNKKGVYVFAYSAQPYSISFLFLGWAWSVLIKRKLELFSFCAVFFLMFVATGMNPSILLVSCASFVMFFTFVPKWKIFIIPVLAGGFFFFWLFLSKHSNVPHENYVQFNNIGMLSEGLRSSLLSFEQGTERLNILVAMVSAGVLVKLLAFKNILKSRVNLLMLMALVFALFWWMIFALSSWASRNDFHFRYFYPTLLTVIVFISLQITEIFFSLKNKFLFSILGFLLAAISLIIVRPYIPMPYWHSSNGYDGVGQYMSATNSRILTGGYWQVWPALFRIQSTDRRKDVDGTPWFYGASYRGKVNQAEMDSLIVREMHQGKKTSAVCIGADPAQCLIELSTNTSFSWKFVKEGNCLIPKCYLLEVQN